MFVTKKTLVSYHFCHYVACTRAHARTMLKVLFIYKIAAKWLENNLFLLASLLLPSLPCQGLDMEPKKKYPQSYLKFFSFFFVLNFTTSPNINSHKQRRLCYREKNSHILLTLLQESIHIAFPLWLLWILLYLDNINGNIRLYDHQRKNTVCKHSLHICVQVRILCVPCHAKGDAVWLIKSLCEDPPFIINCFFNIYLFCLGAKSAL